MKAVFAGVGEAFDERLPNTSIHVETNVSKRKLTVLLDCGFTAAAAYFSSAAIPFVDRQAGPDMVWISHFHGDHFFGLPVLLARLMDSGRSRDLAIVGQPGLAEKVVAALDLAYPNLRAKLPFDVAYYELEPGQGLLFNGLSLRGEFTSHGSPCLGLRLDDGDKSLFYSGDGGPTSETLTLARGCDLVIQEGYGLGSSVPGHGTVEEAAAFACEAGAASLAVVHVQRDIRRNSAGEIRAILAAAGIPRAFLPEPGAMIVV